MSTKQRQTENEEEKNDEPLSWIGLDVPLWFKILLIILFVMIVLFLAWAMIFDTPSKEERLKSSSMSRSKTLPGMSKVDYGLE